SLAILTAGKPDATQCEQVGQWLGEETRKDPRNTALLNCLCALRHLQKRYPEAKEICSRVLDIKKTDALALNNLAYFTPFATDETERATAPDLIFRAQQIVGPLPELLDTEAVILMTLAAEEIQKGKGREEALVYAERAKKVLEGLLADAPSAKGQ